jgi:hypothetical protein
MNIFPWPAVLVSVAVVVLAVVWYRGEVVSRREQGRAARAFIASGRPVPGWSSCWAWSSGPSPAGTDPVPPGVQGPSPAGTRPGTAPDAPVGVSVEGVAPVGVGGAS